MDYGVWIAHDSRKDTMKWDDQRKIFVLSAAIRWWMYNYYGREPVIGDNTFDLFYRELEQLERKVGHKAYDSPTKTPGGT